MLSLCTSRQNGHQAPEHSAVNGSSCMARLPARRSQGLRWCAGGADGALGVPNHQDLCGMTPLKHTACLLSLTSAPPTAAISTCHRTGAENGLLSLKQPDLRPPAWPPRHSSDLQPVPLLGTPRPHSAKPPGRPPSGFVTNTASMTEPVLAAEMCSTRQKTDTSTNSSSPFDPVASYPISNNAHTKEIKLFKV